ncbi:MAG: AMP-binding protein [Eubacteriales bacterium]|jgi:acetyl-CoA synthetase|nr:AMP-binding protein [Clostridiales bacterium]
MDNQIKLIASRIAELRAIRGKTVAEMAAVTGVTEEEYLRAEAGELDLSFTFVHNCARELGVDITALIKGEDARLKTFSVVRAGEGMRLQRRRGFKYEHLASAFAGRLSEPFLVTVPYDAEAEQKPIPLSSHVGEEFDFVLRGTLKVQVAGHTEILHAGDAIYYDSSQPHGMIAVGGEPCEFIAVVTDALGRASTYGVEVEKREEAPVATVRYGDFVVAKERDGVLVDIEFPDADKFNFAFDCVDKIAAEQPDKLAMLHVASDYTERRFTFGDMSRLSSKAANYFASLGIGRGDRVMLVLKRHWQFWPCILGLHKLGAVAIPATHLLMKKDFEYRFEKAGVAALVCTVEGETIAEAEAALASSPTVRVLVSVNGRRDGWHSFDDEFMACSDVFERTDDTPCGDDDLLEYFSSGTTGYPKVVLHSHKYPLGHFITAKYWHNVREDGLHFTISDTGWGKAMWGKLYGQWLCGGAVFTYDFNKFEAADILPMFEKYKITTFCAPPTMYRFFIKEDLSKYDFSSVTCATVAGEALNPEVYQKFLDATGLALKEGYGQTETTLVIANLYGTKEKPGSMGLPSPLYDIDLVDADGKPVPTGETGEIVIRVNGGMPCGLFKEYYNDSEATQNAWAGGVYHTGDMAWRDEDGYFWYVSRCDDIIKSSGYRIGPFEIESVIMELPFVLECAVTGVPDEVRGQVVRATIVPVKGYVPTEESVKIVQEYVKTHTAPYKYPRIVEFVDELPKTISGKIKRVDIRNR